MLDFYKTLFILVSVNNVWYHSFYKDSPPKHSTTNCGVFISISFSSRFFARSFLIIFIWILVSIRDLTYIIGERHKEEEIQTLEQIYRKQGIGEVMYSEGRSSTLSIIFLPRIDINVWKSSDFMAEVSFLVEVVCYKR